jgi:hypothetical protein
LGGRSRHDGSFWRVDRGKAGQFVTEGMVTEKEVDAEEERSVVVVERRRLLLERKEDRLNAFDAANNTC